MVEEASQAQDQGQGQGPQDQGAQAEAGSAEPAGWLTQLPKDVRSHEALQGLSGVGELATGYAELKARIAEMVKVPGDGASDEEIAAYRNAIGVPESPDKYELEKPDLPPGLQYSQELESQFKKLAHETGLSASAASKLYGFFAQQSTQALNKAKAEAREQREEAERSMKKEWGQDYEKNVEALSRSVNQFGGPDFKEFMDKTGFGNDPRFIQFLANVGKRVSGGDVVTSEPVADVKERNPYPGL